MIANRKEDHRNGNDWKTILFFLIHIFLKLITCVCLLNLCKITESKQLTGVEWVTSLQSFFSIIIHANDANLCKLSFKNAANYRFSYAKMPSSRRRSNCANPPLRLCKFMQIINAIVQITILFFSVCVCVNNFLQKKRTKKRYANHH